MTPSRTFQLAVVTPERVALSCPATFVTFPAFDGEMGILAHHAPLLAMMGTGELSVESPAGHRRLYVDGGFAHMVGSRLTILTEDARDPATLDPLAARRDLAAAREMRVRDDASLALRERAERRARVQLRLRAPALGGS